METVSYSLWQRFVSWFTGEPLPYLACPTKHAYREDRLNLLPEEGAWDFYQQCTDCGKEFRDG